MVKKNVLRDSALHGIFDAKYSLDWFRLYVVLIEHHG